MLESMMSWPEFFIEAIGSLETRIPLAMQADGCRENWLQTEVMMFAYDRNVDVWTNYEPVVRLDGAATKRSTYDFAAYRTSDEDAPTTMIAEIKIMAGHFMPKCLVGKRTSLWRELIPIEGQRRCVTRDEILAADNQGWGLLPDAARLLHHPCPNRYLVLVLLDLQVDETDGRRPENKKRQLHAAMDGVTFVKDPIRETVGRFDGFTVKVWSL